METKVEQTPENINPVLSVDKNGCVLYSNVAGDTLLNEWGVKVGEKLPSSIEDLVQKVISLNNPEKMEVKAGNRIYLVVFHPSPEQECVNISGFDISDQKEIGEKVHESEVQRIVDVELAEIVDAQAIQSLMDDFYILAQIPMSLDDLRGNVLVGVGWQDICTKFHRINPETCKHCMESSTTLSEGILHGEFKLYKCKNNMWHIATPVMIGGQHVGNIISGQFFFDDEPLDYEFYRSQARKYGFNEEEYISALEKVPRLSRKSVDTGMSFFIKLANLISQLSYSNTKLIHSLVERDTLMEEIRKSDERFRSVLENSLDSAYRWDLQNNYFDYISPVIERITGFSPNEINVTGRNGLFGRIHPDDCHRVIAGIAQSLNEGFGTHEYRFKCKDGNYRWLADHFSIIKDKTGENRYRAGIARNITEQKQAEEALRESEEKFRSAFDDSAVAMALVCPDARLFKVNDAFCRLLGFEKSEMEDHTFIDFTYPEDIEPSVLIHNAVINREKPVFWLEKRYIRKDGRVIWCEVSSSPVFDSKGCPIYTVAHVQDITERKQMEETLAFERSQLLSIFDGMDDVVYVTDPYTFEVLYTNKAMREKFGDGLIGGTCYKKFQRKDFPCDFCTNQIILKEKGNPYHWEYYNPTVDRYFMIMDRIIKWPDGRDVRLEIAKDITERKRLEEQTRQRAEELETLMDVVPVAIFIGHDPDCHNITGNLMANKLYEARLGENVSANVSNLRHIFHKGIELTADELPMQKAAHEDIDVRNDELDWLLPSGERRAVIGSASPLHDTEGNVRGSVGAFIDITDRKQMEDTLKKAYDSLEAKVKERTAELEEAYISLKESEERLSGAQRIAHLGNYDNDLVSDKLYWSDELYRIFGLQPQEGMTFNKFLTYIHPDDKDYVNTAVIEAINGKHYAINYRIVRPDGEVRFVHSEREAIFDKTNKPIRAEGTIQDVTEHKKSEEKIQNLANIVESSNDAIVTVSLDSIVTSWNKGAEQIFGYAAEEILGKKVTILEPDNLRGEIKQLVEQVKQGKKIKHYESSRLKKDGTIVIISGTLSPVIDTSGKLVAISVIVRDITDRKRTEEAMAKIEIARKQEIHHRIKNNLQVISSLLDLQAEKFNGKKSIKDSDVLEAFRESQDRVISMALIHEELHKGGEIDTLNFSHYIEELIENLFLTYRIGNEGIILDTDLEEDIFFDMDTAVPLGMIINELVSNSLKHAFPDRDNGEIQIKLHREENGKWKSDDYNPAYVLTVSDNGIGIPEDIDIEDIDSLGLQLVTTLVDQLDGKLELKRGNGTEFIIRFAVAEKDNHATAPQ